MKSCAIVAKEEESCLVAFLDSKLFSDQVLACHF